jgi:hypothetical protein
LALDGHNEVLCCPWCSGSDVLNVFLCRIMIKRVKF